MAPTVKARQAIGAILALSFWARRTMSVVLEDNSAERAGVHCTTGRSIAAAEALNAGATIHVSLAIPRRMAIGRLAAACARQRRCRKIHAARSRATGNSNHSCRNKNRLLQNGRATGTFLDVLGTFRCRLTHPIFRPTDRPKPIPGPVARKRLSEIQGLHQYVRAPTGHASKKRLPQQHSSPAYPSVNAFSRRKRAITA